MNSTSINFRDPIKSKLPLYCRLFIYCKGIPHSQRQGKAWYEHKRNTSSSKFVALVEFWSQKLPLNLAVFSLLLRYSPSSKTRKSQIWTQKKYFYQQIRSSSGVLITKTSTQPQTKHIYKAKGRGSKPDLKQFRYST